MIFKVIPLGKEIDNNEFGNAIISSFCIYLQLYRKIKRTIVELARLHTRVLSIEGSLLGKCEVPLRRNVFAVGELYSNGR